MRTIQYVGRREWHKDATYSTGEWAKGQTKGVSDSVALKLLRHPDVYIESAEVVDEVAPEEAKPEDDEQARTDDLLLSLQTMSKEEAVDFAKRHFQIALDKRKSVENLRSEAINLLHQFGAVK